MRRSHAGVKASSLPPAKIAPVTLNGVVYAQIAGKESIDGQVGGLLAAYSSQGEVLWTMKVYDNRRRPELEGLQLEVTKAQTESVRSPVSPSPHPPSCPPRARA